MFVTSFLSGLALLSAIVRVAVAWLRAVEPSEALQLVLLNPTMLGAVVVWTLWGQLIAFVLGRGKGRDGGERTASAAEAGRDKERGLFRFGGRQRTGASRSFNVAAALAGLLLPLVAAVGFVAVGGDRVLAAFDLPLVRHSPELGVPTLPPDIHAVECRGEGYCAHIDTSPLGFRTNPFALEPTAGNLRVLTAGDSFVFGSGAEVHDTLSARLAESLDRLLPEQGFEVLNLGIPGFSFHSTVRLLETMAPLLKPQWVVIGFLRRNDLDPYDPWERIESLGMDLWVAAALLRVDREWIGIEAKREAASTGGANDSPLPGALVERFRDDVGRLLALRERLGFQAVIFSYHGASPLLAWAAEQGVVVLAPSLEQQDDPAFVIPGDGHPTPPANRAYADIIARTMQRSFETAPSE